MNCFPDDVNVPPLGSGVRRGPAGQHGVVDVHAVSDQPAHRISSENKCSVGGIGLEVVALKVNSPIESKYEYIGSCIYGHLI